MADRLQEGQIVDGRYTLKFRVGSGGMADVYCAEDLQLGRKVALKVLYPRFAEDEEFVERFRREASSAAGLQHQNVVSVYDRGEHEDTAYIAMEFVDGRTFKDVILEEGPLEPGRAIEIVVQVLRAARFAHKRGIIHRDLKPHNVIVDAEDRAKVTDFGIARAGASDMTQTGSIMGTAQYLSPEQAQGLPVSAQSDLYSVGIMLYEALTGSVPFDADSAVAIALKQVSEPAPAPSERNPQVSHELDQVVLRALAKDPQDRFEDADAMVAALEHALSAYRTGGTAIMPGLGTGSHPPVPGPVPVGNGAGSYDLPSGSYVFPSEPYTGQHTVPSQRAPGPEDEDGGLRRWVAAAVVGVVVVAALVLALLLLKSPEQRTVVSVVGRQQAEAIQLLQRAGFSTDTKLVSAEQDPGTVIGQDPGGGKQVDKGSTVTLTVSSGPQLIPVPAGLVGQTRTAARTALTDLGFTVREDRRASDTVTTGRVISTSPAEGEKRARGSSVTIVVSTGPDRETVPGVVGQSLSDATATLDAAGFEVSSTEQESETATPGTVISQDPGPDAELASGGTVKLVVAKAPAQVSVPGVVGRSTRVASARLSAAGLEVATDEQPTDDPADDGKVVAQTPAAGTMADKGTTVTLTVGRYTEPETTPTTTPSTSSTTTTPDPSGTTTP